MTWAVRQSLLTQAFPPETPSFVSTTLAGSLLLAYVTAQDGNTADTTAISVSDPVNGNWTRLIAPVGENNVNVSAWIFYTENAGSVSAAQSVTLSLTNVNTPSAEFLIVEVTGIATSGSPDPPASAPFAIGTVNAGAVTNTNAGGAATIAAGDLYVVSFVAAQTETWVTPASWTLLKQSGSIAADGLASAYYYLTSTSQPAGTVSVTETATAATTIDSQMSAWQIPGTAYLPPIDPIYVHRRT